MSKRLLRVGQPGLQALKRTNSKARSHELEKRRQELVRRLTTATAIGANPKLCRTATTLLNRDFRFAKWRQRASILASAEWVVRLLEAATSVGDV